MIKLAIRLRLHYLIIPLLLAFLLYVFSMLFFFLPAMERNIMNEKKQKIAELTNVVYDIIDYYNKQVEDSLIDLNTAQKIVIDNIKEIRYGNENKDYFWINDYRPYMIMHPYLPEMDSTDLSTFKDPDGTYLFNQMVELVIRNEHGFLNYKWQLKNDTSQILPKISYVKAFKPWDWIIGTGMYISDVESEMKAMKQKLLFVSVLIIIIALVLYGYVIKRGIYKERHLQEIEIKYKKIFEEANDAILLLKDDYFIDCNTKALRLFKCKRDELIGRKIIDFSNEYQEDGVLSEHKAEKIIEACKKGKSQFFEWNHQTLKGKPFIAEVSLTNIKIENTIYLISFIRDVTKRKNSEKQLIQAMEKAEASDKLKSAFLANMSHEIRTPMNGILGFAQLIQDNMISEEKKSEYLEIILNKGNQLMQIINDIVDISKIESNQITINNTEFSINKLIDDLSSFFSVEYRNLDLITTKDLPNGKDQIKSDHTRLTQILTNLLSNAFKFTEKGYVEFGYKIQQQEIYFFVKDTGIGIKNDDQKIIFDRFRQSDETISKLYGGTGLGLSISKGLVKLLGGEIGVESDGENGSKFYFTIPLELVTYAENKIEFEHPNQIDWKEKSILVVEDDDISFFFVKELLEETKAKIQHVKTGIDAIESVKKENFNIVLMDVQLPGMDGNTATKEIRKFNNNIPIIAQTANAMADDREKSIAAGCNDYIAKPIDGPELLSLINQYIN